MAAPLMPEHGTTKRYRRGCHCRPCTDAVAVQAKKRVYQQSAGTWVDPFTDAAPARARLLAWREAGYGWMELSASIGMSDDLLHQIALGRPSKPAPARIRRDIAEKILATSVSASVRPGYALVDAVGTQRRLRALAVAGWHLRLMADRTGVGYVQLCSVRTGALTQVRAQTADAVRRAFERIGGAAPGAFGYASKDIVATVNLARRAGWPGADRWGEDIDDPAATPLSEGARDPRPLAVFEDAEFIRRTTGVQDYALIAQRLGITASALDKNMQRARVLLAERERVAA
jgi:hypothetical protein